MAQMWPSKIPKKLAQIWPSAWAKKSLDPAQPRPSKNSGPGGPAPAEFFSLPIPDLSSVFDQFLHQNFEKSRFLTHSTQFLPSEQKTKNSLIKLKSRQFSRYSQNFPI
jgi:hypothetical protein